MIFTLTGKAECPECGEMNEFEAEYSDGEVDVKCPKCGEIHTVTYTVCVEVV